MTAHKEIETLWKFIRGCLRNYAPKLQTAGAAWLKSRVFLFHGMCEVLWGSFSAPAPLGVEWGPSCHHQASHREGQGNPTLSMPSSGFPHSGIAVHSSYVAV